MAKQKVQFFNPNRNEAGSFGKAVQSTMRLLRNQDFWFGLLFLLILLFLFVSRIELSIPNYKLGDIAQSTIRAPQDTQIPDTATTERKRKEAKERVLPVYDFEPELANTSLARMHEVFTYLRTHIDETAPRSANQKLVEQVRTDLNVVIAPALLARIQQKETGDSIEKEYDSKLRKIMAQYIVSDRNVLYLYASKGLTVRNPQSNHEENLNAASILDVRNVLDSMRSDFEKEAAQDKSSAAAIASTDFLSNFIVPTIYLNTGEYQARVALAAHNTEPVYYQIKKGKVIVRDGEDITPQVLALLQSVQNAEQKGTPIPYSIGILLLLCTFFIVIRKYLSAHQYSDIKLRDKKLFLLTTLVLVGNIVLVKLGLLIASSVSSTFASAPFNALFAYQIAVPFAAGALLLTILTDRHIGIIYSFGFAILTGVLTHGDFYLALYCLAGSMAAANSIGRYYQRSALLRSCLWIWLVNLVTICMIHLLQETGMNFRAMAFHAVCAFVSAILAAGAASVLAPLLEWMFNITTDIKLLELSNLDLPVLRQLALEAPGTYHHSIVMGTIAEAAAEKVGANPLFLRVSALYHDIGKVRKSEYYVENQREENKHDTLNPRMSALVIINHVKEGIEVAKMLRLPSDVAAMIPQHHGTRLITYFYKKAKDLENPEIEEVKEEDYRYPGPKPQSKEGAILMLADATEAASRTLTEPSPARLRNMVHTIFRAIFEDGQLDESNLTMKDLTVIAEAFVRKLESVFHHRIAYPGYEFNRDEQAKGSGTSENVSEKMAN